MLRSMPRYLWFTILAFVIALGTAGYLGLHRLRSGPTPLDFPKGILKVYTAHHTYTLHIEVASTEAQLTRGLMYRTSLPPDAGMLFIMPSLTDGAFWMYHTLIPLSIAFISGNGVIEKILQMQPCTSQDPSLCPQYFPNVAYRYALEVNLHWFRDHGVHPGDYISFTFSYTPSR